MGIRRTKRSDFKKTIPFFAGIFEHNNFIVIQIDEVEVVVVGVVVGVLNECQLSYLFT